MTNADSLQIGHLGTNLIEIEIEKKNNITFSNKLKKNPENAFENVIWKMLIQTTSRLIHTDSSRLQCVWLF